MQQKTNIPLILGIIGAAFIIPGMIFTAMCGAFADAVTGDSKYEILSYVFGLLTLGAAVAGSIFSRTKQFIAGLLFCGAVVVIFITFFVLGFGLFWHWVSLILFIIAAVMSFLDMKKPSAE